MDDLIISTVLTLSAIVMVLPTILAIRKNTKEGLRFQFSWWDYIAFIIGVSPVLLLIGKADWNVYLILAFVYCFTVVTAAICWTQTALQRRDFSRETNFWMLLGGAACGYVWIVGSVFISIVLASPYMANVKNSMAEN